MANKIQHTPGKWTIVEKPIDQSYIVGEDGLYIASVHSQADGKRNEELKVRRQANAKRIVKAVNMHDELVAELKTLYNVVLKINGTMGIKMINEKIEQLLKQAEQK